MEVQGGRGLGVFGAQQSADREEVLRGVAIEQLLNLVNSVDPKLRMHARWTLFCQWPGVDSYGWLLDGLQQMEPTTDWTPLIQAGSAQNWPLVMQLANRPIPVFSPPPRPVRK